jgi:hypothetical protein
MVRYAVGETEGKRCDAHFAGPTQTNGRDTEWRQFWVGECWRWYSLWPPWPLGRRRSEATSSQGNTPLATVRLHVDGMVCYG